jgi:Electron transfer DM13
MRLLRHRRLLGLLAVAAAGLTAFVLAYFEPQKLFIDDRVAEAVPAAPTVKALSAARFRSYEHATRGRARTIATADGRRYVRFEDFETSNGPALKVYLSAAPATGPGDSFDDRFVDLGDLKGNIGSQNYAIPRDVPLDRYRSVVVWCERFSVPFAAAAL